MEPVTTAALATAAKQGGEILKKQSDSFLSAVLGEPAKALGGLLADKINKRRHANLIKITSEAKRNLAEAKVKPTEVPLSIIHPAIQAAANQEDPELQTVWANLLANAADPRQSTLVSPSFPIILRELTTRDVRFIDALYTSALQKLTHPLARSVSDVPFDTESLRAVYASAGLGRCKKLSFLTHGDYDDHGPDIQADLQDFGLTFDVVRRHNILTELTKSPRVNLKAGGRTSNTLDIPIHNVYQFSYLGAALVRACRKPESDAK